VLDRIDEAMVRLELDPSKVVVVTDIGCVGLSDQWFVTHAFHGLHGRSVVYGEGLKLASPDLHVIVLVGDGGAGIGLHHLLNAAKRNAGVTVILFNNMNFGMTGGEHSITTPEGAVTTTTVGGHFERPLQLCETLRTNFAPFVARRAYYDKDLVDIIEKAIAFDGFSFVEVLEFCVAYYVPLNKLTKKHMEEILQPENLPRTTVIDESRTEYSAGYREYCRRLEGDERWEGLPLERKHQNKLKGCLDVVFAGSAGMRIGSTGILFARAAIMSGLRAVQRDDYPVTVRTGHSVSSVKLSEHEIGYMGIKQPDVLFILSEEGHKKAKPYLDAMGRGQKVYILSELPEIATRADVVRVDLEKLPQKASKEFVGLSVLSAYLQADGPFPLAALTDAIRLHRDSKLVEKQLHFSDSAGPEIFV
jgi:pyruvate/2-oxoacid:ferredoxin oxidoreductase beta subunit/Pyruvate/2-oxoacid:ferredoxin oxidoreductase gamma subunit